MKSFLFSFNFSRIKIALFFAVIASMAVGRRKFLVSFIGGFDEYATIFLYVSDFLLILCLLFSLKDIWRFIVSQSKELWFRCLMVFLASALISVSLTGIYFLTFVSFLRLVLLVVFALGVAQAIRLGHLRVRGIFCALIILGIFEALLGFSQFVAQSSVGLKFLGEPNLPGFVMSPGVTPQPAGIAKIDLEGGKLIRAYGTFPHPNILAAFLLLALAALFYFWISNVFAWREYFRSGFSNRCRKDFWHYALLEIALGIGIFIVSLGLLFSFSRAAWLIAMALVVVFSLFGFLRNGARRQAVKLFFLCIAVGYMLSAYFNVLVFPRAHISLGEPAVSYRLRYDELGFSLITNHPLGVGIGNQVVYSVRNSIYNKFGMPERWAWQPIHNIYLLMASEIGIVGAIAFVFFLVALLISNLKFIILNQNLKLEILTLWAMLITLLLFGLVDHFLWTLQPGSLMLWLAIGMMLGTHNRSLGT